jgi:hypothetical protein
MEAETIELDVKQNAIEKLKEDYFNLKNKYQELESINAALEEKTNKLSSYLKLHYDTNLKITKKLKLALGFYTLLLENENTPSKKQLSEIIRRLDFNAKYNILKLEKCLIAQHKTAYLHQDYQCIKLSTFITNELKYFDSYCQKKNITISVNIDNYLSYKLKQSITQYLLRNILYLIIKQTLKSSKIEILSTHITNHDGLIFSYKSIITSKPSNQTQTDLSSQDSLKTNELLNFLDQFHDEFKSILFSYDYKEHDNMHYRLKIYF